MDVGLTLFQCHGVILESFLVWYCYNISPSLGDVW